MNIQEYTQFLRIRAGGGVKRFHTMPLIGEQTVAAHTWGVLQILLWIEPRPSIDLLKMAIYHDTPEYDTGDTPSHAKRRSPALKILLDSVEDVVFDELGISILLTIAERKILKAADLIEMLVFVREQEQLGNRSLDMVWERVIGWLKTADIPERAKFLVDMLTDDRFDSFPSTDRYRDGVTNAK